MIINDYKIIHFKTMMLLLNKYYVNEHTLPLL